MVGSNLHSSNWLKSECWLLMSLGESVKNWEPSDPAGGRDRDPCGHPGEAFGGVSDTGTPILQDPTAPSQKNSDTHRHGHMCYKDTWAELMLAESWDQGLGRVMRRTHYSAGQEAELQGDVMQTQSPFLSATKLTYLQIRGGIGGEVS